jgi:hypothetical protein
VSDNDQTSRLKTGGQVVLDGSGNGAVTLLPDNAWQHWAIERINVRTNQAPTKTPFPQCELFLGTAAAPSDSQGATAAGHNDVFDPSGGPITIGPADALTLIWTAGVPGSIATVVVTGTKTLRRA